MPISFKIHVVCLRPISLPETITIYSVSELHKKGSYKNLPLHCIINLDIKCKIFRAITTGSVPGILNTQENLILMQRSFYVSSVVARMKRIKKANKSAHA